MVIEPLITALLVLREPLCGLKQMKKNMEIGRKEEDRITTCIFIL
jgi:hypothetical protein